MEFVIHWVVQALGTQVAPMAVEAQRSMGGGCAGHFEQATTNVQAGVYSRDFGGSNGQRQLRALIGAQGVFLVPSCFILWLRRIACSFADGGLLSVRVILFIFSIEVA